MATIPTDQPHFALTVDLFERNDVEQAVDMLLELLDRADGDPDEEAHGDELDGDNSEDDFMQHHAHDGQPGCPIADPGGAEEAEHRDSSWPESHSRSRYKLVRGEHEPIDRMGHEDDEDDDPSGQCDEDGINSDLSVLRNTFGPGCVIADPDRGVDDDPHDEESDWDGEEYRTRPVYGVDQSKGPTNEDAAARTHRLALLRGEIR